MTAGFGGRPGAGPERPYQSRRFELAPPETVITTREAVARSVLSC